MPAALRIRRDRRDAAGRIGALLRMLGEVEADIARERSDLGRRHEWAAADAAFAQQGDEDAGGDPDLRRRVEELTRTLEDCTRRMGTLERQAALVSALRRTAARLAKDDGPPGRDGAPPFRPRP